jgi:uncharacterized protein (DUF58 family)
MKVLMRILRELYIKPRLYNAGIIVALFFTTGFFVDVVYLAGKITLLLLVILSLVDFYLLFLTGRDLLLLVREVPEKLSNGDENRITLYVKNNHVFPADVAIIDELPQQFQIRDFTMKIDLEPGQEKVLEYTVRPTQRGEYAFGRTLAYVTGPVGLFQRQISFHSEPCIVPVYPSFLKIRKFEFLAISNRLTEAGIKRIRKIGQHSEFDQIRDYVTGDDIRSINWKATAKKGRLMANQYQDERSQQIYNIIDMGRVMKMPFDQLSLLDYAVNSSLVLSNTALFKHDKAGLITFNTSINTFMQAERRNNTMARMLEILYRQNTLFLESNFELLYITIKRAIPHRSLLILYTNFESVVSLNRHLSYLQHIARNHLLLVVIFENIEITRFRQKEAKTLQDIYTQTIAEKFIYDKSLIVKELNKHGILSILSKPHELSVNLVNKYLELKDRNLI